MKRFRDRSGIEWDVVLGRESWGASVALFVPATDGDTVVRQAMLHASAVDSAFRELDAMGDAELQALLDRSKPKQENDG